MAKLYGRPIPNLAPIVQHWYHKPTNQAQSPTAPTHFSRAANIVFSKTHNTGINKYLNQIQSTRINSRKKIGIQ